MRKMLLTLIVAIAVVIIGNCSVTVGVTTPLLESERNLLPDKTIESTFKEVKYKNNTHLTQCLDSLMKMVVDNVLMWRTFSLKISPVGKNYAVSILQIDPTMTTTENYMGSFIKGHCHFLVVTNDGNKELIETLFKREGEKVKYVREFEFVEDKSSILTTTCIEATIASSNVTISSSIVEGVNLNETGCETSE